MDVRRAMGWEHAELGHWRRPDGAVVHMTTRPSLDDMLAWLRERAVFDIDPGGTDERPYFFSIAYLRNGDPWNWKSAWCSTLSEAVERAVCALSGRDNPASPS